MALQHYSTCTPPPYLCGLNIRHVFHCIRINLLIFFLNGKLQSIPSIRGKFSAVNPVLEQCHNIGVTFANSIVKRLIYILGVHRCMMLGDEQLHHLLVPSLGSKVQGSLIKHIPIDDKERYRWEVEEGGWMVVYEFYSLCIVIAAKSLVIQYDLGAGHVCSYSKEWMRYVYICVMLVGMLLRAHSAANLALTLAPLLIHVSVSATLQCPPSAAR